jgi:DNA-binding LacI/PurR family transcriptional regulator
MDRDDAGWGQVGSGTGGWGEYRGVCFEVTRKRGVAGESRARKGRRIHLKDTALEKSKMRIIILLGDESDRHRAFILELLNALQDAGYLASLASKTLEDMGGEVDQVARFVDQAAADAWVVFCGSKEVLEWFVAGSCPSFAISGRRRNVQIPSVGPDKVPALRTAVQRLVELGHRRIVMLCQPVARIPKPGLFQRVFLEELEAHGIQTGPYNLPNWDESTEDFHRGLDSLFGLTPPTAVIIDDSALVFATLQFCMKGELQIPRDFSLVSSARDVSFERCQPSIAHIKWDSRLVSKRILEWAENVTLGKGDFLKKFADTEFVEGNSIGPAPQGE